ncbi:MAG: dehydratase [Alphaproteobacteria bacterium HGW-Alphaproteobacteria-13]|nr:MAG: dehydratase [Alphaproteobacteria bacterium HGW-Alphaproteobacteria-13]
MTGPARALPSCRSPANIASQAVWRQQEREAVANDVRARAKLWAKGRLFEDFHEGQRFEHHWGRTISESDTVLFSTLTLSFNPLYFNRSYAIAHDHPDIVVNPQLVFNVVLGLTVEDCSEIGGPFLGVFDLDYHRPVYPGITLRARSETVETRLSASNPANGIVTWETEGVDDAGERVVSFRRSNLVARRHPEGAN